MIWQLTGSSQLVTTHLRLNSLPMTAAEADRSSTSGSGSGGGQQEDILALQNITSMLSIFTCGQLYLPSCILLDMSNVYTLLPPIHFHPLYLCTHSCPLLKPTLYFEHFICQ